MIEIYTGDFNFYFLIAIVFCGLTVWLNKSYRKKKSIPKQRPNNFIISFVRELFPLLVIFFLLTAFVAQPFLIPSGSMLPSLEIGDRILVKKYSYGLRLPLNTLKLVDVGSPERGDVAVFRYPDNPSVMYIKRIVALPGDAVEYRNKKLWINGMPLKYKEVTNIDHTSEKTDLIRYEESFGESSHEIYLDPSRPALSFSTVVPEKHYFVLGDNRDNSRDSRFWGYLSEDYLVGKASFVWFSFDSENFTVRWERIGEML